MTVEHLRVLLRWVAILAGVTWGYLCWRAYTAPETWTEGGWRTLSFCVLVCAGMLSSRSRGGDDGDETL